MEPTDASDFTILMCDFANKLATSARKCGRGELGKSSITHSRTFSVNDSKSKPVLFSSQAIQVMLNISGNDPIAKQRWEPKHKPNPQLSPRIDDVENQDAGGMSEMRHPKYDVYHCAVPVSESNQPPHRCNY